MVSAEYVNMHSHVTRKAYDICYSHKVYPCHANQGGHTIYPHH